MIPIQIDHIEQGLARLLDQWKNSPKLIGLLTSFLKELNNVEDIFFQLLNERGIFEAVGVQLDILAALFGITRDGRLDEQLRSEILRKITLLNTDGTTEVFMQSMRTVTNTNFVDFWEHNSGDTHARLGDGFNVNTYSTLKKMVPAATSLRVYVDDQFDSFTPTELIQTAYDLQTSNGEDIQVTPDGSTFYDLQVQLNIQGGDPALAILPEIQDTDKTPYLAELLFSDVKTISGYVVDNENNLIIDNENNSLIWVDYEF